MTVKLFSFFNDETGVLTTQPAPYIEDGWYIETHKDGKFKVFEIPQNGGEAYEHAEFCSFNMAYELAVSLT